MPPEYRVLLAEDNPVNQEVGRAMLETLGCTVDVAQNGLEAVHMVTANRYHLVFMDCQMPRMDGLEATAKIRDAESGKAQRTPIIALTAYVMEDEIEECRAAGMDDFLSKPFSLADLSDILERWAHTSSIQDGDESTHNRADTHFSADGIKNTGVMASAPLEVTSEPLCLDPRALANLKATFGMRAREMTRMVISIYRQDSPALLNELCKALKSGDTEALHRAVHTLKSSSANLGALSLAESCKKLENRVKEGSLVDGDTLIDTIKAQHREVLQALREVIDRGTDGAD